ncbi:hypothetical protein [Caldibacillus debilis]|uniref:hypothetical protein n=1 Tax=Caldibacillus debilis TaxID=301148 RepID=UPI0023F2B1F7|nr:hypothetical protein [Caldibacillus debilis]
MSTLTQLKETGRQLFDFFRKRNIRQTDAIDLRLEYSKQGGDYEHKGENDDENFAFDDKFSKKVKQIDHLPGQLMDG